MAELFYRIVNAQETVFSQGDIADCAYVVESGEIEVRVRQDNAMHLVATVGAGELLGEMGILDATPRSADAIARTNARLIVIERDQLAVRMQAADPVLRLILVVVLGRLRQQLEQAHAGNGQATPAAKTSTLNESAITRIVLENELRAGLASGEMEINVQPIANMANGEIAGFEALVRWHHPVRGMIRPDEFIKVAEESGLIIPLGRWILHQSCLAAMRFQTEENSAGLKGKNCFISVNVSSIQIHDPEFVTLLDRELRETGLDPRRLKLEITESVFTNAEAARRWINACKALGVRIALDDFGTGYSSLSYLHDFDIDTLKIDQSFVRSILNDARSEKIVAAIAQLSKTLEMDIIAEGVETQGHYDQLARLGCQYAQGYLISRPVPVESYFKAAPARAGVSAEIQASG